MSDPGHGPPVDALDTVCKKYKDCLKCARLTHGEMCIGEFIKYDFSIKKYKQGNGMCHDDPGSCGRKLCECDAMFAEEHVTKAHVFDADYHLFWSTKPNGWEPKAELKISAKFRSKLAKIRYFGLSFKFLCKTRNFRQNSKLWPKL